MSIDWADFTPSSALAGGALIGLAAALLILGIGRVMKKAGIVGGALEVQAADAPWRWSLIAGLVLSPLVRTRLLERRFSVFSPFMDWRWSPQASWSVSARGSAQAAPAVMASVAWRVCRRARLWGDGNLHGDGLRHRSRRPSRRPLSVGKRVMKRNLFALAVGLIFGLVVSLSGMV